MTLGGRELRKGTLNEKKFRENLVGQGLQMKEEGKKSMEKITEL